VHRGVVLWHGRLRHARSDREVPEQLLGHHHRNDHCDVDYHHKASRSRPPDRQLLPGSVGACRSGPALASGVAAVVPAATPEMVDITGVALDGRLLSSAARTEARSGSAGVLVSFEALMQLASSLAESVSAQDFMQAADGLETSLALELARGGLNYTIIGVNDLWATLEFVAAARTTTLSGSANDEAGANAELLAVIVSLCIATCCVGIYIWKQSTICLHNSQKCTCDISDRDVIPAATSGPGLALVNPIVPIDDGAPTQPPCSLRKEPLTERSLLQVLQLARGEETGSESIASRHCCNMTIPGVSTQPLSMIQDVGQLATLAGAPEQEASIWRLKIGERATLEGVWEMPWDEKRQGAKLNGSCKLVEVIYQQSPTRAASPS